MASMASDLVPPNHYLWGSLQAKTDENNPHAHTLQELKDNVIREIGRTPSPFLSRVIDNFSVIRRRDLS